MYGSCPLSSYPLPPRPNPPLPQPARNVSFSARRGALAPSADESPAPGPGPEEAETGRGKTHSCHFPMAFYFPFISLQNHIKPKILNRSLFL